MRSGRWFGIAAVTAVPGLITTLATANGCVGDDPGSTPATTSDGSTTSSSSGSTSSSSGSTPDDGGVPAISPDAAPSLGCPLGCLPPAPTGWTGPSAIYDGPSGTKPAGCPAPYTLEEVKAHQGMTVGATTCDCGAGTNSGAKCNSVVERYVAADCTGTATAQNISVPGATCVARDDAVYGSMKVKTPTLARGSCTYAGPKVSGPAATFDKENVACGLPQLAICSEKAECVATPIPDQPFTRLCIHKAGEESCPSLDYTARFVAYQSSADDRTCTCTGNPTGGACGASVTSHKLTSCATAPIPSTPETCTSGAAESVGVTGLAPTGVTCPAGSMSGSAGSVKDVDPVTFCCNK